MPDIQPKQDKDETLQMPIESLRKQEEDQEEDHHNGSHDLKDVRRLNVTSE